MNVRGAFVHGTEFGTGLVVPRAYEWLAVEAGTTVEEVEKILVRSGAFDLARSYPIAQWGFKSVRKNGKESARRIRLAVLMSDAGTANGSRVPENSTLSHLPTK